MGYLLELTLEDVDLPVVYVDGVGLSRVGVTSSAGLSWFIGE